MTAFAGSGTGIGPGKAALEIDYHGPVTPESISGPLRSYFTQWLVAALASAPLIVLDVFVWFALLITGRWPPSAYRLMVGCIRFTSRVMAYVLLVVDDYPPWSLEEHPEYPLRLIVGPPKPHYSRPKTVLRVLYVVPALLAAIVWMEAAYVSTFAVLLTGKRTEDRFRQQRRGLARFIHYMLLVNLVIEDYDWHLAEEVGS